MIDYNKKEHARELIRKELEKQGSNFLKPDWKFVEYLREKYRIEDL